SGSGSGFFGSGFSGSGSSGSGSTLGSSTLGSSGGAGSGSLPQPPNPVNKIPIVMMNINLSIFFITYLFFVKIQGGFSPEKSETLIAYHKPLPCKWNA
ncbi:MAG TPA: hypothetical protein DEA86_01845, partial [Deltaproteobacteria bacterium]|nr:hypothetical protein [Deltaproteobacteria bacterium]